MTVRDAAKQASLFERVGSLHAGRHPARFLKRVHRHCIPGAAGRRDFLLHDHMMSCRDLLKPVSASFRRSSGAPPREETELVGVDRASRFHALGGSVTELSVTENCHGWSGDERSLHQSCGEIPVNIARCWKIRTRPSIPVSRILRNDPGPGGLAQWTTQSAPAKSQRRRPQLAPRSWGCLFAPLWLARPW